MWAAIVGHALYVPALVLILLGATMFLKFEHRQVRQVGRVVLGIAFILLSLRMVGEATDPLRHSAVLPQVAARVHEAVAALQRADVDWHLPRLYEFVQAMGATVINGPMVVPTGQRIVQLLDPQRAAELSKYGAVPIASAANANIRSRVSLSEVRKRMTVIAPTRPSPRAISSPMASMTSADTTPAMASMLAKLRTYDRPL